MLAHQARAISTSISFFWADDTSIARPRWIAPERGLDHGQVTDAHLVALCVRRRSRLVTFDRGVVEVLPGRVTAGDHLLVLEG